MTTIDAPGVYPGLGEAEYHADPVAARSLSVSGAKKLLPPSTPARFHHEREHGQPPKPVFDFGHAAHAKVLGIGADVVVIQTTAKDGAKSDAKDRRTKSAQEHEEEIRAAGAIPLLATEVARVDAMAEQLRAHPTAAALFAEHDERLTEASAFWPDPRTGIWRRARFDIVTRLASGRLVCVDYKTAENADPDEFGNVARKRGYHMQDTWYRDTLRALDLDDDPAFLFVVQEKEPPYLVSIAELDADAKQIGAQCNAEALDVYMQCTEADHWPGYSTDPVLVSLPYWYVRDNLSGAAA